MHRYLAVRKKSGRDFEVAGSADDPPAFSATGLGLKLWDRREEVWMKLIFPAPASGRRKLQRDRNCRPAYGEVPTNVQLLIPNTPEAHWRKTIIEMEADFASSGDDFTRFDRAEHRSLVRQAVVMGYEVPVAVLADYPEWNPANPKVYELQ